MKIINNATKPVLERFDETAKSITVFNLKGEETAIPNESSEHVSNPAQWLIYAELAARDFEDTPSIPKALVDKFINVISSTSSIVPAIVQHIKATPSMQEPAVMDVFTRGIMKLQNSVVRCGSYQELKENAVANSLLDLLRIKKEENYEAVLARAKVKKPDPAERRAKPAEGKCPFGYG